MKAVILAGGEGTRLRPLTCNLPKPLVPVCTKPVLEYILDLLAEHGCTEAVIALRYKGEKIERHFSSGTYKGITLGFSTENSPLGTAGCVKEAAADFDEDFVVISGDAMCDIDLSAALEFHKKKRSRRNDNHKARGRPARIRTYYRGKRQRYRFQRKAVLYKLPQRQG